MLFTLVSFIASTPVKKGRIFFSETTFHAVPRASAELSRTVGSEKINSINKLNILN